ncbi:MAG: ATP-binding domain-containing protein [Deltaproteobacteria bacterium]|nr:ATP-binding domain-containing protein [Deltaproteobacteria bacterium]
MALTENDAQEIGKNEEDGWKQVHMAILNEMRRTRSDFEHDRRTARDLTSQIVASRRDEDKAALASDEAVAHGLAHLRKNKSTGLESLAEHPYFARVIADEEGRKLEFKLGTASFPEQRIIDWRKAPITKLYYDYREGEEFSETIQGQEHNGVIELRRSYKGIENELQRIETAEGVLIRADEGWKIQSLHPALSRGEEHDGHLPPILSLITAEQFALITKNAQKPVVIQGIAGSGKTTVALHRLAWLLHEDNSDAQPQKCLVVMFNRSLKAYVETTMPELKIHSVPIRTFTQWCTDLTNDLIGPRPQGSFEKCRHFELFKSSSLCLKLLMEFVMKHPHQEKQSFVDDLMAFYTSLLKEDLIWRKWDLVKSQIKEQVAKKVCDQQDDPLLLHLVYAEYGYYPVKSTRSLGICDHIVIDEAPIALTVSFRSTIEIMQIAEHLRGQKFTKGENSSSGRRGPVPTFRRVEDPTLLAHRVGQWIAERQKDSAKSLSAIICRWPKQAVQLVEELRKIGYPSVRLGHREQFDFSPGITITNVHQVKGLEFRNVLIVEPSEENYNSENEEEANLLYVAVTRAEERLDFIGNQKATGLLPTLGKAEKIAQ